ncbi:MAG TPA: choice-of-anchor Q domain-containing protein [Thermoanaerobaculia bacterium]|nr:choice-of-anchor Q domain-containing protein [Thermoanaerobaculia bacterium]
MFFLVSHIASATVVGSGTPSSCTEAALSAAIPAGGIITFNCGAGPQTIPFSFTLVVGSNNPPVTIEGNDAITFDGNGITTGMIAIFGGDKAIPYVAFRHLTITNGNITTGLNAGGAIQNFGTLALDTVTLRSNHSSGAGAIFQEPCTGCLTPSLFATHCLFQNNVTGGGAISIQGGVASIEQSTFDGNSSSSDGAIQIYGNSTFQVDVRIDSCTFVNNVATGFNGGAIGIEVLNPGSNVQIVNDTFTGNSSGAGGHGAAIYAGASPVSITNCTIAGNNGGTAGGAVYFAAPVAMNNTIIASNTGHNCSLASGSTFSGGHNLQFGDSTCTGVTVANPLLGSLADNNSSPQTMALGAGSPAIDAADPAFAPVVDQRGFPRTDGDFNGTVLPDIGSFEAPGGLGNPTGAKRRAVRP